MSLTLYNTLTRKKEDFETIVPGEVSMYVCGPTVYDKAHVGHAMSALVFDIIRRYLEYKNYKVKHAMNFTDVDDKIINRANLMNMDPFVLAEGYIQEFEKHLDDLNILSATSKPRATGEIENIIDMIKGLIESGYAYEADGDVYFRVEKFNGYGKLSGRKLDDMHAGARINVDTRKEHPMDFALWKSSKPGEPSWDSPWGKGRPGWHIECSVMSLHHLGEQIDIHGGGNDLVFPHHENEIAQSESFSGKPFASYWVHNGMLQLSGEKMSKSIGNLVTIGDFLKENEADVLRMMVLNSGYRSPLTFNDEVIEQTRRALDRLKSALRPALPNTEDIPQEQIQTLQLQTQSTEKGFIESMDDDFNTAGALGNLFDLVRSINQARADGATDPTLQPAQAMLKKLAGILGLKLKLDEMGENHSSDGFIDLLIELRTELRNQKLYEFSDMIRDRLEELDVILEDSKTGTSWHWKQS